MITVNDLKNRDNFFLMAGPCAIEGEDMALRIAEKVVGITNKLNIPYIFKGSYRKANRSRLDSFTGTENTPQGRRHVRYSDCNRYSRNS